MPTSTIPYDPSLVLGMIVVPERIEALKKVAELQKTVDAARDRMNALLRQKLSLDMTSRELVSLGASPEDMGDLNQSIEDIMKEVTTASIDLGKALMEAEKSIAAAAASNALHRKIKSELQSPVDFKASQLKGLPIGSDSVVMNAQYFEFQDKAQSSKSKASPVSEFAGKTVSRFLGPTLGAKVSRKSSQSGSSTYDDHQIIGTLVIVVNWTSQDARVFSPLELDADAAAEGYVRYQDGNTLPLGDRDEMQKIALAELSKHDQETAMPVLIGVTYGSSFIGCVHFEQLESPTGDLAREAMAAQVRAEDEADLFLAAISGSIGLDDESLATIKELMNASNVLSHCSVMALGSIPSVQANDIESTAIELKSDPAENMAQLTAIQDSSITSSASMATKEAGAKVHHSVEQMKSDYIKASVSPSSEGNKSGSQMMDVSSLTIALDDYVKKISGGKTGLPINFHLKYITKRDIALAWMKKYYPDLLSAAQKGDDVGA